MDHSRSPSRAATRATVAAVALLFAAWATHRLGAQQTQPTTNPQQPTEHHGFGYGVPPVVVQTPTAQAPAQPALEANDDAAVHLDQLMTLREWDATGVARLRPEERAALEAWVQRYRSSLVDATSHPADATVAGTAASNGDVAQPTVAQPATPPVGYASAYAVPAGPPAAAQAPVASATYPPPAYVGQPVSAQPPASYAPAYAPAPTQAAPYAPPAGSQAAQYAPPAGSQAAPQGAYAVAAPQAYQPTYAPGYQPAPAPQPAPTPAPQGYAPQAYPNFAQSQYAPPSYAPPQPNPAPAAVVGYPVAPTAPSPYAAPASNGGYSVTVIPASPAPPAGAVVRTGLSVQSVQGGNRFVTLTDGSMWDVYAGDRGEAGVWRAQDPVYVRLATTSVTGGYDREIVNATRNVLVRVKFAGQINK